MTNSERALATMTEHAQHYKALFHSMQEELIDTLDAKAAHGRVIALQRRVIAQQRAVIAKLESELGIDQEL